MKPPQSPVASRPTLFTNDVMQRGASGEAPAHGTFLAPLDIGQQAQEPTQRLAMASQTLGKQGSAKTFDDLRRAVVSAQLAGEQLCLRVGGALGRWLHQGANGPAPTHWQLLLVWPETPHTDGPALADALRRICKRLVKRGFVTAKVVPDAICLRDAAGADAVLLHAHSGQHAVVPNALACEQLSYEVLHKTWHTHPNLTLETARAWSEAHYWRAPSSYDAITNAYAEAPKLLDTPQAFAALCGSWRHQQLGYSPTDPLDLHDVWAFSQMLLGDADAIHSAVRLVHDTLVPELCAQHSAMRRKQLGLAMVALQQLSLLTCGAEDTCLHQPLIVALRSFVRGAKPFGDDALDAAVAIAFALVGPEQDTQMVRLLLKTLGHQTAQLGAKPILGISRPMLRIALPALHTHLFVPDVTVDDVVLVDHLNLTVPLSQAIFQARSMEHVVAQCLSCPALEQVALCARIFEGSFASGWANTLSQLLHTTDDAHVRERERAVVLLDLLRPSASDMATERAPYSTQIVRELIAAVALYAESFSEGAPNEPRRLVRERLLGALVPQMTVPNAHAKLRLQERQSLCRDLITLGAHSQVLALLEHDKALREALEPSQLLHSVRIAHAHEHALCEALLQQAVVTQQACQRLVHEPSLAAPISQNKQLHVLMSHAIAQVDDVPEQVWNAWFKTACNDAKLAALSCFVVTADVHHPRYALVTDELTQKLLQNFVLDAGIGAAIAWVKLLRRAQSIGHNGVRESAALLEMYLKAPKSLSIDICGDETLKNAARTLMGHKMSAAHVALTLAITERLFDVTLRCDALARSLEHLSADAFINLTRGLWHDRLWEMLQLTHRTGRFVAPDAINTIAVLADRGMMAPAVCIESARRAVVLCGQILVRHDRADLCYSLYNDAFTDSSSQHLMLRYLDEMKLFETHVDGWTDVVAIAGRMMSPDALKEASNEGVMHLHKAYFWSQVSQRLVAIACHQDTLAQLSTPLALKRMQGVEKVLHARHVFVPLSGTEQLIKEFALAASCSRINEMLLQHLIELQRHQQSSARVVQGPWGDGPHRALFRAIIAGAALFDPKAAPARAKKLLTELFDVEFDSRTGYIRSCAGHQDYLMAVELADIVLQGFTHAQQQREFILSLFAGRINDPDFAISLELLTGRLPPLSDRDSETPISEASVPEEHSALAVIVRRVVQDLKETEHLSLERRKQSSHQALTMAFTLRTLKLAATDEQLADFTMAILDAVHTVDPDRTQSWYAVLEPSLSNSAASEPWNAAVERFNTRFNLLPDGTSPTTIDTSFALAGAQAHIVALMQRMHHPLKPVRYEAINDMLAWGGKPDMYPVAASIAQVRKTLTLLCSDEGYHSDVMHIALRWLINPQNAPLPISGVMWLHQVLSHARPITAAHVALIMALIDDLIEKRQVAPTLQQLARELFKHSTKDMQARAQVARELISHRRELAAQDSANVKNSLFASRLILQDLMDHP